MGLAHQRRAGRQRAGPRGSATRGTATRAPPEQEQERHQRHRAGSRTTVRWRAEHALPGTRGTERVRSRTQQSIGEWRRAQPPRVLKRVRPWRAHCRSARPQAVSGGRNDRRGDTGGAGGNPGGSTSQQCPWTKWWARRAERWWARRRARWRARPRAVAGRDAVPRRRERRMALPWSLLDFRKVQVRHTVQ